MQHQNEEASIAKLVEFGYDRNDARQALVMSDWNVDTALNFLLDK
jgi:uncharacterized UBP type Zn finger protein